MIKTTTPRDASTPITMFSVAIPCMAAHYSIGSRLPHGEPKATGCRHLKPGYDSEGSRVIHIRDQHPGKKRSTRVSDVSDGPLHAHSGPQGLELRTIGDERRGGRGDDRFAKPKPRGQDQEQDKRVHVRNT